VKSVCEKYKEQCHENDLGYNHGSVSFGFPDNCITVVSNLNKCASEISV
jgi:hypothetical protein